MGIITEEFVNVFVEILTTTMYTTATLGAIILAIYSLYKNKNKDNTGSK